MRQVPPFFRVGSVLGVSVVATVAIVASQEPTALQLRSQGEVDEGLFNGVVLEAPFAAEAVTTWTPPADSARPEYRSRSRMYRDRAGRVRVEQTYAGQPEPNEPHRIFLWPDPQRRAAHLLDPVARTVVEVPSGFADMSTATPAVLVIPVAMNCVISFHRPQIMDRYQHGSRDEETLGQKMLLGIPAAGTRFVTTLLLPAGAGARAVTDERWVSRELGLVLHSRAADPAIGAVEHRITRLSLVEPSARTFEIPPDYGPGEPFWPTGFDNPHALVTWRQGVEPCQKLPAP